MTPVPSEVVLTTRVDLVDAAAAGRLIAGWARDDRGRMVCATNVHMVMEAYDDPSFSAIVNGADLVVADGRPVVWACRLLGRRGVTQVRGFDLTTHLCAVAERDRLNVGLYGGSPATVQAVRAELLRRCPGLRVTFVRSPPFRPLTPEEDVADLEAIRSAEVHLLFVGLGCPKQERWMAAHRDGLPCTAVGVGAVFDMLAGEHRPAPRWVQRAGLEWVHRLTQEPGRLWGRYARHNSRFIGYVGAQCARRWRQGPARRRQARRTSRPD